MHIPKVYFVFLLIFSDAKFNPTTCIREFSTDPLDRNNRYRSYYHNDECPIVVENENLTFDINEFPKQYYNESEDY